MNVQHSSETGEWYTPPGEIEAVRKVLEGIMLDPCGSDASNEVVQARDYFTSDSDPGSLERSWFEEGFTTTAFVNPPGACRKFEDTYSVCGNTGRCSCKLPKKFLAKSIAEATLGMDIVYLAYSVNQIRQLSNLELPYASLLSMAVPPDRIPYLNPVTLNPVRGTNCDSAFVCLSGSSFVHANFRRVFGEERGCAIYRRTL